MCGSPPSEHRILGRRSNGPQGAFPKRKPGITVSVSQCRRCSLIFADPQPIPYDLQDHYGVPPESYWKEEYFEVADDYLKLVLDRFKRLARFRTGMTALDIGAGLGKAMVALERAGFDTYGIEPSLPFRERAITRMGLDPDRLLGGSIENAAFDTGSFDFITFGAVLEHLYDPSGSLAKALTWLRPGGLIHVEVPSSHWLIHRIINTVYRIQGSDHVANLSPMHPPYHLFEFDVKSFTANGAISGYRVAHAEHYVSTTYLPIWMEPLMRWYMRRTDTGMQLSIWLTKR